MEKQRMRTMAYPMLLIVLCCGSQQCLAQQERPIQPYVSPSKLYALYKPANWKVSEEARNDSFRILVASPDGASTVDFFWARNEQGRPDALWLVKSYKQFLSQTYPEVAFSEIFAARDATRAMATVSYRTAKTLVKGHYYFESGATGISAQGYLAPEAQLPTQRPILLNVMASLAFAKSQGPRADARAPQQAPLQISLVPRQAQDGSLSMRTPPDWNFLAAGGKVIAGSRDGGTGFIFTSLQGVPMLANANIAQGVLGSPYRPPPQALSLVLRAFGHRNIRVLSANPDHRTAQEYAMYTRGARCDAQDVVAQWTSAAGADCQGAIKVICGLPSPTGIWTMILAGVWAPASDFGRDLPILEQVAASFGINDQYARQYIQNGLENLRRLQEKTNQAMRDLNHAREQNQADWEARQERKAYMDSKWDDYRRGNSYWVSELEGGKVYATDPWGTKDTVTGDYYGGKAYNWTNFEGQNPRHPSESMREISSYELDHGGPPPGVKR
jgi:hypothetical protein